MSNKKIIIIIVILIIQILTPVYLIVNKHYQLRDAETYKITVIGNDPYDLLRGKYITTRVDINYSDEYDWVNAYKYISIDEDGYMVVDDSSDSLLENKNYFTNLEIDRYYVNENLASKAEQYMIDNPDEEYYLTVKIKEGEYQVTGLYVNDIPIEEAVK